MRVVICGVDVGKGRALAILSLRKELLFLGTFYDLGEEETVRTISFYGKPFVIATDVNPAPKSVRKMAAALNSRVFHPKSPLSILKKNALTMDYSDIIKTAHERDALAAALKAYKAYDNLFNRIRLKAKILPEETYERVAYDVMRHRYPNIKSSVISAKRI